MMVRLATEAMGTRFELVLDGQDAFFARAVGEQAIVEIREQHDRLSVFNASSVVSRINTHGHAGPVPVDRDMMALLLACRMLWQETDGAFDPSIGRLMQAWGFRGEHGEGISENTIDGPSFPGFAAVELDEANGTVRLLDDRVSLDFGGIGKGWALDRAAEILREAGVGRALVHGGTSSAVAIGAPPDREAWGIEIPSHQDDVDAIWCDLTDAALAVSSPTGRVIEKNGVAAGHVFDPRTGEPVMETRVAAIVCASATVADAWATAAIVSSGKVATMPEGSYSATLAVSGGAWVVWPQVEKVFRIRSDSNG